PLNTPTTITFVTQPPAPTPPASPKPNTSLLTDVQQLATIGDGVLYSPQWSADSGTVYFVTGAGALESVPAKGGSASALVPDGAHAAFKSGNTLLLLEIGSGHTVPLGGVGAPTTFQGWSPNGARVVYAAIVADMNGRTINTLPAGDVAWSAKNRILLGSETTVYSLRPDGTNLTKLADGSFRLPVWAPDSNTFVFVRGSALWVATAPTTPT